MLMYDIRHPGRQANQAIAAGALPSSGNVAIAADGNPENRKICDRIRPVQRRLTVERDLVDDHVIAQTSPRSYGATVGSEDPPRLGPRLDA